MKNKILLLVPFITILLIESCSSSDDSSGSPSNDNGFIVPISQSLWEDTAGTKTYFFENPDSVGHFSGVENEGVIQNSLSGKTKSFDISFTVIKVQNSNHIDYTGKITDTLSTHKRMVVHSNIDTLYLRPQ